MNIKNFIKLTCMLFFILLLDVLIPLVLTLEYSVAFDSTVATSIFSFLSRHFLLNFIFSSFCMSIWFMAGRPWPRFSFAFLISQCILLNAIIQPSLLDFIPGISNFIISFSNYYIYYQYIPILASLIWSTFLFKRLINHYKMESLTLQKVAGTLLLISLSLFLAIEPFDWKVEEFSSSKKSIHPDTIIIVLVDSLDSRLGLYAHPGSAFSNFLREAKKLNGAITPIPQTHGSLAAIFSGKGPQETNIRMPFQQKIEVDDNLSALSLLKKRGYRVEYISDGMEYHQSLGFPFDRFEGPESGIKSLLLPPFFRSLSFHAFLNNELGWLFLPEIKGNTSFNYSYRPYVYRNKIISRLQQSSTGTVSPEILILHTCSMHWPFLNRYPYWSVEGDPANPKSTQFSSGKKMYRFDELFSAADRFSREAFYRKNYEASRNWVTNEILQQVFEVLNQLGYLSNSTVALVSDHGEDFPSATETFRMDFTPQHGASLLFSNRSEVPQVLIKSNKVLSIPPDNEPWKYQDLLKLLSGEIIASGSAVSETGLWPFKQFKEQMALSSWFNLLSLGSVDKNGQIILDQKKVNYVNLLKQRSVYIKNKRYTVYPTIFGFRDFLCDLDLDKWCEINLIDKNKAEYRNFVHTWQKEFSLDIRNGWVPNWPLSSTFSADSKLEAQYLTKVQNAFTSPSKENILKLAQEYRQNSLVSYSALEYLVMLCSYGFPEPSIFDLAYPMVNWFEIDKLGGFVLPERETRKLCINSIRFPYPNQKLEDNFSIHELLTGNITSNRYDILKAYKLGLTRERLDLHKFHELGKSSSVQAKKFAQELNQNNDISPRLRGLFCYHGVIDDCFGIQQEKTK